MNCEFPQGIGLKDWLESVEDNIVSVSMNGIESVLCGQSLGQQESKS